MREAKSGLVVVMVVMVVVMAAAMLAAKVNDELCFLDRRLTFRNRCLGSDSGRRRVRDLK
jgi:hypothetical protein